jgi:hypothetical protein
MRAGFAAVLLLVGWLVFFQIAGVSIASAWNDVRWQYIVGSLIALTPGAGLLLLSFDVPRWLVIVPQMLSASAAAAWVLTHYGWLTNSENRSPRAADAVGEHPRARLAFRRRYARSRGSKPASRSGWRWPAWPPRSA